jgi:hypothetical protein
MRQSTLLRPYLSIAKVSVETMVVQQMFRDFIYKLWRFQYLLHNLATRIVNSRTVEKIGWDFSGPWPQWRTNTKIDGPLLGGGSFARTRVSPAAGTACGLFRVSHAGRIFGSSLMKFKTQAKCRDCQ